MSNDLKIIHNVQERTTWTQSWWAVAIVALGVGGGLALTKLSWWYGLAVLVPTFVLGYLLKDKIANPFVRLDPNMGPSNDRATWSQVLLPGAMIMSTAPTPDSWPWMIVCGVVVSTATAWMLYENRNAAVKGVNVSKDPSPRPAKLDPVIHPINRLKICATLFHSGATGGRQMKYAVLAELTELPADTLSKQLKHLEDSGYISRTREYGSTRAKDAVWVALTQTGTEAYAQHVTALKAMTEGS